MIQIDFTAEGIEQLHYERFHHPHPRVQQKMEALYLKSQKYAHKEITKLLRIAEPTLLSYLRDYKVGGIDKLKELTSNRPQSMMKQYQESIKAYFREHPPKNLAHAAVVSIQFTTLIFLLSSALFLLALHNLILLTNTPWILD
jgi:hypothetical protein